MGYTHYWHRVPRFDDASFHAAVRDVTRVVPRLTELGIPLAGSEGEGAPVLTEALIAFNGSRHCGHPANQAISLPWPTPDAGGVATTWQDFATAHTGHWYAGAEIGTRVCDGECSYESFIMERVFQPQPWQQPEDGYYFAFCKTAFRPYDLAVTAALVILQHHLGAQLRVSSDGEAPHWFDAQVLCQIELGYGLDFHVEE